MLVGTAQQEAIWNHIANEGSHLVVKALAGTGKTTTCVESLKRLPAGKKALFCAFNKSIAEELAQRLPRNVVVSTIHSLGFTAYKKRFGRVRVDRDKCYRILTAPKILKDWEWDYVNPVLKLVGYCKFNLVSEPNDEFLKSQVDRFGMDVNDSEDRIFELVRYVLKQSIQTEHVVDFDDMLFMPIVKNVPCEQFDIVFVDESQDLNPAMQELVFRHCRNGRMVVVGDPNQAIYGFMGADLASMANMEARLRATERGCLVMPLTATRRCPKKVVELARATVPDFEALPEAPEGSVEYVGTAEPQRGDMVVCRVNAPLMAMALSCLRRGIPAMIAGRDIADGLQILIKKLRAKDVPDLMAKLDEYEANEIRRLERARRSTIMLEDKCATLRILMEGETTIQDVEKRLKSLFVEKGDVRNAVLCTTMHRAKGLEAPIVWIINPELCPHPKAVGAQVQQEYNLWYVAVTRAKQALKIVDGGKKNAKN